MVKCGSGRPESTRSCSLARFWRARAPDVVLVTQDVSDARAGACIESTMVDCGIGCRDLTRTNRFDWISLVRRARSADTLKSTPDVIAVNPTVFVSLKTDGGVSESLI